MEFCGNFVEKVFHYWQNPKILKLGIFTFYAEYLKLLEIQRLAIPHFKALVFHSQILWPLYSMKYWTCAISWVIVMKSFWLTVAHILILKSSPVYKSQAEALQIISRPEGFSKMLFFQKFWKNWYLTCMTSFYYRGRSHSTLTNFRDF